MLAKLQQFYPIRIYRYPNSYEATCHKSLHRMPKIHKGVCLLNSIGEEIPWYICHHKILHYCREDKKGGKNHARHHELLRGKVV